MVLATSFLPVPVSPVMSTGTFLPAAFIICARAFLMAGPWPMRGLGVGALPLRFWSLLLRLMDVEAFLTAERNSLGLSGI